MDSLNMWSRVLMWARQHGCPWADEAEDGDEDDEYTMNCCAVAAGSGHL
jgi:hypothetical protein